MYYVMYIWNSASLGELHCYKECLTLKDAEDFIFLVFHNDPHGVYRFVKLITAIEVKINEKLV